MIKILFICHGNICRSPMAEFVMKDIVAKAAAQDRYEIASAATTYEEIGNPVYPPARRILAEHDIRCDGKTARRITLGDYKYYDLIIGMDEENKEDLLRFFGGDPDGKIKNLPDYAGNVGGSIADPWYTRNFEKTWSDIVAGCTGLFSHLENTPSVVLDFSQCLTRADVFDVLKRQLPWEPWSGSNLDALYDILTDLPSNSARYQIRVPDSASPVSDYISRMKRVFADADKLDGK